MLWVIKVNLAHQVTVLARQERKELWVPKVQKVNQVLVAVTVKEETKVPQVDVVRMVHMVQTVKPVHQV